MKNAAKIINNVNDFIQNLEKITANITEKEMQNLKGEGAKHYQTLVKTIAKFKDDAKEFIEDDMVKDSTVGRMISEMGNKIDALKNNKPLHDFYDESQDFFSSMKKSIIQHPVQAGLIAAILLILIGKK